MITHLKTALVCSLLSLVAFNPGKSIAQEYYEVAEAYYVTLSRNPEVIQYIICLEGSVYDGGAAQGAGLAESMDRAANECRDFEAQLPQSPTEPTGEELRLGILECGFRPGDASPDMDCGDGRSSMNGLLPTKVISRKTWLREGPTTDDQKVALVDAGVAVTVIDETVSFLDGFIWFYVTLEDGREGFQWGGGLCALQAPIPGMNGQCPPELRPASVSMVSDRSSRAASSTSRAVPPPPRGGDDKDQSGATKGEPSGGYGGFEAYLVDMEANEILTVRSDHVVGRNKLGVLPATAEGIFVYWCEEFGRQLWCLVEYDGLRGWVFGDKLQNVEGGY